MVVVVLMMVFSDSNNRKSYCSNFRKLIFDDIMPTPQLSDLHQRHASIIDGSRTKHRLHSCTGIAAAVALLCTDVVWGNCT